MPLKLHQEETPTINLTSMIDVVFLLLIFFMVGTRFRDSESNIAIDLPRVSPTGAATDPGASRFVNILADGAIDLDGRLVSTADVTRQLQAQVRSQPATSVIVRPDARVSAQRLLEVFTAVRQSGVQRISVANQNSSAR